MPPGQKRDPHYMPIRGGKYISLHSKAKTQYAEDDPRFNSATMGNRIFKKLPNSRDKATARVADDTAEAIRKAAGRKIKIMGYGSASKARSSNSGAKRMGYGSASKGRSGYGRAKGLS